MARRPLGLAAAAHPQLDRAGPRLVLPRPRPRRLHGRTGAGLATWRLRRLFTAPVHENTTVELVETSAGGLRVVTDQRTWLARNVVVAAGTENRAYVPPAASGIHPEIHQLTAARYRGPGQVPGGGVLVVGASASGVQIADELRRAAGRWSSRWAGMPGCPGATGTATSCGGWTGPGSWARPSIRCTTHGRPAGRRRCSYRAAATALSAWMRWRRARCGWPGGWPRRMAGG